MRGSTEKAKEETGRRQGVEVNAASVGAAREANSGGNTHKPARARFGIHGDTNSTMAGSAHRERTVRTKGRKKGSRLMNEGVDEAGYGNRGGEGQQDMNRKRNDREDERPGSRRASSSSSGSARGGTPPAAGGPTSESDEEDTMTPPSTMKKRRIMRDDDDADTGEGGGKGRSAKRRKRVRSNQGGVERTGQAGLQEYLDSKKKQKGKEEDDKSDTVLREYVRSKIFKNIKFVVTDQELEFDNHICKAVLEYMRIAEVMKREWWSDNKKKVQKQLGEKRSTTASMMKNEVLGKWWAGVW